ncbi:DNA-binding protein [Brevibacterium aurantiacum]|nr:DNA-binding protein [Brevibacterium aurantiacum]
MKSQVVDERLLTTRQVSEWLVTSPATLCRWRQSGKGPRWVALGDASPRYRREDIETWIDEQASC